MSPLYQLLIQHLDWTACSIASAWPAVWIEAVTQHHRDRENGCQQDLAIAFTADIGPHCRGRLVHALVVGISEGRRKHPVEAGQASGRLIGKDIAEQVYRVDRSQSNCLGAANQLHRCVIDYMCGQLQRSGGLILADLLPPLRAHNWLDARRWPCFLPRQSFLPRVTRAAPKSKAGTWPMPAYFRTRLYGRVSKAETLAAFNTWRSARLGRN